METVLQIYEVNRDVLRMMVPLSKFLETGQVFRRSSFPKVVNKCLAKMPTMKQWESLIVNDGSFKWLPDEVFM